MLEYEQELTNQTCFTDKLDRSLAQSSGAKFTDMLKRLRKALLKENKNGTFKYDDGLISVKRVCEAANAMSEYHRLVSIIGNQIDINLLQPSSGINSVVDSHHKTKAKGKETRIVATWILGIGATSERFDMLKSSLDVVSDRTIGLQKIVSNIGIGRSKNTKLRQDAKLLDTYDQNFSVRVENLLFPNGRLDAQGNSVEPKLILRGDDDLTTGSARRVYRDLSFL